MKRKSGYIFENFILIVFTITYILSIAFLYSIFIILTKGSDILITFFGSFVFLIGGIFLWAYLIVLFKLPQKMSRAFDPIKNRIATKEISNPEEFAKELNIFLPSFFNFAFFDIEYSSIKIEGCEISFSSDKISDLLNWKEIDELSRNNPDLKKQAKIRLDKSTYFVYSIPIFFEEKYLGYFTVFAKQRLGNLNLKFLSDLEENFVDDQLLHVLS